MALNDPDAVRRQLLAHFDDPPTLTFARSTYSRLDYRTPDLDRDESHYTGFSDRPAVSRHVALEQLQSIVHQAATRLDYAETTPEDWDTFVRFSGDRLEQEGDAYGIRPGRPGKARRVINHTREDAQAWFSETLTPIIQEDRRGHVYILGDPGAGKSTLVKYLINRNARSLYQQDTVFSRFEFIKFCDRYYAGDPNAIRSDLSTYISFLLLRDLILRKAYGFDHQGRRRRILPRKALADIVRCSFEGRGLDADALIEDTTERLHRALEEHGIHFLGLRAIKGWIRALLVDHLQKGMHIALVIDGLDCVAIEDSAFGAERHHVLQQILKLRPVLTDLRVPVVDVADEVSVSASIDVNVSATLIFVMRENTLHHHGDGIRREVPSVRRVTYWVGSIDPDVALLNLIQRGVSLWMARAGGDPLGEAYTQLMMRGVHTAFRHLGHALRARLSPHQLMALFGGNLRSLFEFVERLIAWLLEDAVSSRLLDLRADTNLEDVLNFITGPDGSRVLGQRSYRLIELLLFQGLPWFEPLVRSGAGPVTAEILGGPPAPRFIDNPYYTGFVDNLFNYHVEDHRFGDERHPLLEKVRIIQLLSGPPMTPERLKKRLEDKIGYASENLAATIQILLRAQLIRARLRRPLLFLKATRRGELLVSHIARSMTYLEHVYHQTLFPKDLLPAVADAPRERGVEAWTAASIRNCFVFLTYLRFVETNRARNIEVPGRLRIYKSTSRQVRRSLVRIIGDPRDGPPGPRQLAIATEALTLIGNIISRWDYQGYVAALGEGSRRPRPRTGGQAS